ncbi:hypothetical protein NQ318_005420 [Aromia moschata]|uniref:HTH CENPB-type domain-containing protein n=1 Tax=Aromia moschata TaxID=1265417 RepID=A0AAV8YVM5_9CUCU|nr:hypothetical protein NQ318_005420 [Aromia moschata]
MSHLNEKINERRFIKRLSFAEKLQVIEYFKNGMKNKDLSEKYKVHHSAISKIIHNKDKILQHKETMAKYDANKNVLRYSSKRALGEPVTGPVLQAKAKQFHASLNVDSNFSASNGWLARFKKRHRIRCLNIKGEKLSANEDDASACREGLKAFLENHGYKLDNIYNGDETSLFRKHFPKLLCVETKLKHQVEKLPKIVLPYKFGTKKSWMDRNVFIDWYKNVFIPSVKKRNPDPEAKFAVGVADVLADPGDAIIARRRVNGKSEARPPSPGLLQGVAAADAERRAPSARRSPDLCCEQQGSTAKCALLRPAPHVGANVGSITLVYTHFGA